MLARIEGRRTKPVAVEIFTSLELSEILTHASADLRPCIALAAFAGLRSEEILRLEWSDLDRRLGFVEVSAHKAKTAARRLVPITDNLAAWLAITPRNTGRVWPHSKAWFFESIREAVAAVNEARKEEQGPKFSRFVWKQNALRHSFITYRVADTQDVNRVALEAGNSPQMIFKHYRELATPDLARSWFAIEPLGVAANVVPITSRSVAS